MDQSKDKLSCFTCKYFSKGIGVHFPDEVLKGQKIIGQCLNYADVKTEGNRICVSYGMLCNGKFHSLNYNREAAK